MFNNLLVTGGAGFIGANYIRYLLKESGFTGRVVNFDALTYAANPLSLQDCAEECSDRYVFEHGDLNDLDKLNEVVAKYEIDAICHFAAESHVDRSIVGPGAFIQSNIVGTYSLLESFRAAASQVKLFHHVSTDEVFGSLGDTGFFEEQTPYSPNSPYAASKAASDHLVRAYAHTYNLPITITNCSNNYGPYQFPEKLIPLMILNAIEGKPLPVYGDGLNVRDWLYVSDHCKAIWLVMNRGKRGETYTIGGRNEKTNLDVVNQIVELVDQMAVESSKAGRKELIQFVKDRPGHDRRYAINCDKIERELGWRPEESFETGLRKTVRWYLDNGTWIDSVRSGAYRKWIESQYGISA